MLQTLKQRSVVGGNDITTHFMQLTFDGEIKTLNATLNSNRHLYEEHAIRVLNGQTERGRAEVDQQ